MRATSASVSCAAAESDALVAAPGGVGGLVLDACSRIDRFVLDHFIRRRPTAAPAGLRARLARAGDFYADPRFIAEPERFFVAPRALRARRSRVAPLPGGELLQLRYESDFRPVWPEARDDPFDTATRRGVALWWRHERPRRPAMLCVHGYGGGQTWLESLAFQALRFYRAGVDVVIYVLPYHGARTPPGARHSGEAFFDMDLVRTNEAFARAIYELRALLRYLRADGAGRVGAFGMSLGGYTTALLATVEPELAFAVPMIPVVAFADRWWSDENDAWLTVAMRHGWSRAAIEALLRVHEPLARPPLVPHAGRLIIGARADAICTPRHAELLWRHWDRPRIHWYSGGHLMQIGRTAALGEVQRLIDDGG